MDNKNFLRKSKDRRSNRDRDRNDRDKNRSRSKNKNKTGNSKNQNGKTRNRSLSKNRDNFGSKYTSGRPRDFKDRKGRDVKGDDRKGRDVRGDDRNFIVKRDTQVKNIFKGRPPLTGQTIIKHGNTDKRKPSDFIQVVTRETPTDRQKMFEELSESLSQHFETPAYQAQVKEDEETEGFLFVYEANGVYFRSLNDIDKADGRLVIIHPVFYAGYNNTMFSEEVTYDESKGKYVAKEEDRSWLDVIYNYPEVVYSMDLSEAIVHDEKFFHCDGDLAYYLLGSEPETVTINGKTDESVKQLEH